MKEKLMKMLENRKDEMIKIRRYLHENPELSFQEKKTSQYIVEFYKGKNVEIQTNVGEGYGIIVTIGSFDGKGTFNVIKDKVELEGDVRGMTEETRELIEKEIRRIAKGIEEEFNVTCELTYTPDYPPLYNNPELTKMVETALKNTNDRDIKEVKEFPKLSPSEDFAHYAKKFPACFFYICCTPKGVEKPYFNHHPKFDIDEDALLVAAKAVGTVICDYYQINE
ncbi:M20/M25/M40 family metallo-hydrolase [Priestia endophytica]